MSGYAKMWTDCYDDKWFIKLSVIGRSIFMQLIVLAKLHGDTGRLTYRSWNGLADILGADRATTAKNLRLFAEQKRVRLIEEEKSISITIVNYVKWQELDAKNHVAGRRKTVEKSTENLPLPEQNTTEQNTTEQAVPPDPIPYQEIITDLNTKTGKTPGFRWQAKHTQELIRGRWGEGYRLADFLKVHDNKCSEWLNDPKWAKYLCPTTLYLPSHFEKYLNQVKEVGRGERTTTVYDEAIQMFKTPVGGDV